MGCHVDLACKIWGSQFLNKELLYMEWRHVLNIYRSLLTYERTCFVCNILKKGCVWLSAFIDPDFKTVNRARVANAYRSTLVCRQDNLLSWKAEIRAATDWGLEIYFLLKFTFTLFMRILHINLQIMSTRPLTVFLWWGQLWGFMVKKENCLVPNQGMSTYYISDIQCIPLNCIYSPFVGENSLKLL